MPDSATNDTICIDSFWTFFFLQSVCISWPYQNQWCVFSASKLIRRMYRTIINFCVHRTIFFNIKMRVLNRLKCIYKRWLHSWFVFLNNAFSLCYNVMLRVFSCRIIFVGCVLLSQAVCRCFWFGSCISMWIAQCDRA